MGLWRWWAAPEERVVVGRTYAKEVVGSTWAESDEKLTKRASNGGREVGSSQGEADEQLTKVWCAAHGGGVIRSCAVVASS